MDPQPEGPAATYPALKSLLLGMADERSLDALLARIVRELGQQSGVALARIWLIAAGDICPSCPLRHECAGHVPCCAARLVDFQLDGSRWGKLADYIGRIFEHPVVANRRAIEEQTIAQMAA